MKCF